MTDPAVQFDVIHPSGHLMFRSCPGGYLHSVLSGEAALDTDAKTLARAILLAADVSFLTAEQRIRADPYEPSSEILVTAQAALATHRLRA
jgi:hypothetical protein